MQFLDLILDPIFLRFITNLFISFVGFMLILFVAIVIEWMAKHAEEEHLLPEWCITLTKVFAGQCIS